MVLGTSEESVSRMSSVFSLPGLLSSSVLSKESNHLKYSVTFRDDNLTQSGPRVINLFHAQLSWA